MHVRHFMMVFFIATMSLLDGLNAGATDPLTRAVPHHVPARPLASRLGRPRVAQHQFTPTMNTTIGWIRDYNPKVTRVDAEHYVSSIWRLAKNDAVDPLLVVSLVAQESAFRPKAQSAVGAQGLGQLMPETAQELGVKNPYNAEDNLHGCIKLVHQNLGTFAGDQRLALAAYNAGAGAVQHFHGIPPYDETRGYVHNIMSNYWHLQKRVKDDSPVTAGAPTAVASPDAASLSPGDVQQPVPTAAEAAVSQVSSEQL